MNPRRRRHGRIRRRKTREKAAWEKFGRSIRKSVDAMVGEAPKEKSGPGWMGVLDGACPVQGDGFVDGLPWYFRARHEEWRFAVASTPEGDAVDAWAGEGGFLSEGEHDNASWMPYAEAWALIECSIAEFRSWKALPPEEQQRTLFASSNPDTFAGLPEFIADIENRRGS